MEREEGKEEKGRDKSKKGREEEGKESRKGRRRGRKTRVMPEAPGSPSLSRCPPHPGGTAGKQLAAPQGFPPSAAGPSWGPPSCSSAGPPGTPPWSPRGPAPPPAGGEGRGKRAASAKGPQGADPQLPRLGGRGLKRRKGRQQALPLQGLASLPVPSPCRSLGLQYPSPPGRVKQHSRRQGVGLDDLPGPFQLASSPICPTFLPAECPTSALRLPGMEGRRRPPSAGLLPSSLESFEPGLGTAQPGSHPGPPSCSSSSSSPPSEAA